MTNRPDKELIKRRFTRHLASYNRYAVVQDEVCGRMADLIRQYADRPVRKGLEIGAGTGFLTRRLLSVYPDARWTVNDLVPETRDFIEEALKGKHSSIEYMWGDAETLTFPGGIDLAATASAIQWFDDVQAFFAKINLTPGGLFAVSSFGPEHFREVKETAGNGLEYVSSEETCRRISAAGYDILHCEELTRPLYFNHPHEVLRHMKLTGVNSVGSGIWTRKTLDSFTQRYTERFTIEDGRVVLTYNPVIVIARKQLPR